MKIKNIFNGWINGEIDEQKIYDMNKSIFEKMDNELLHIYIKHTFLLNSLDLILMEFDYENTYDELINMFNDVCGNLSHDLIDCVKKYKNVGVIYNEYE